MHLTGDNLKFFLGAAGHLERNGCTFEELYRLCEQLSLVFGVPEWIQKAKILRSS